MVTENTYFGVFASLLQSSFFLTSLEVPCGLFSSSISRSVFVLFPFWSFKARRLKRVKKADLKSSREFTSCIAELRSNGEKKIWKSTMHGTKKLKEDLKRDLQKQIFP